MRLLTKPSRTLNDTLITRWQAEIGDHVISLAWSPDGRWLAAASVSGPITVYDSQTGQVQQQWPGHGLGTMALSWRPDSQILTSSGQDGQIRQWDVYTGQATLTLPGGAGWVERVAWSPVWKQSSPLLASAAGRNIRLWNRDGELLHEYTDAASTVADIAWRPGKRLLAAAAYGGLLFYHPDNPALERHFPWKGSSLVLAWSPNGQMLATGDQDSTVHFWYVQAGRDLQMWGYPTKVQELAWSHDSRYLATGGGPTITIWDCAGKKGPEGTKPKQLEFHEEFLTMLAYQASGVLLASGAADGRVALWQPDKGKKPLAFAAASTPISQLCWSPDDKRLAVGDEQGGVRVMGVGD